MNLLVGSLRRAALGLAAKEKNFSYRRFRGGNLATQARIEQIIGAFIHGYNLALQVVDFNQLTVAIEAGDQELKGFVYEGAAMGLGILDGLTPWGGKRFHRYVNGDDAGHTYKGIAGQHRYMAYIGYGLSLARLKRSVQPALDELDPVFCWLMMDGYGFHQGLFDFEHYIDQQALPEKFTGYTRRSFDQGLGRSLWFVEGADVQRLPRAITRFIPERRSDLWSGVGLACAYAGGVTAPEVRILLEAAGEYRPAFAQGIALAAMTRYEAGNPTAHNELATQVVWGNSVTAVAERAIAAMDDLPQTVSPLEHYEITRSRLQAQFRQEVSIR